MKTVESGKIIEIKYELREDDASGEVMEVMDEHWPFKFMFGTGALLEAFETELLGKEEGRLFEFTLKPDQAYGERDMNAVIQVFKDDISPNHRYPLDNYEEGDFIAVNTEKGEVINGTILSLATSYILVDTNHAMAGKQLHFKGQILNIRSPRIDEKEHGRYIEPNGFRSNSTLHEPPNA